MIRYWNNIFYRYSDIGIFTLGEPSWLRGEHPRLRGEHPWLRGEPPQLQWGPPWLQGEPRAAISPG